MKELKMMYHSDSFIPALASFFALLMSEISIRIVDEPLLKVITAVSSIVLCLTAIIKLIDICLEKIPKWYKAMQQWTRKTFHKKPPIV